MLYLLLIFIAVLIYLTIPVFKILWLDKYDNNFLFTLILNYLLLFMLIIFYNHNFNIIYLLLISLFLMIESFILIRKIKYILNNYQLLSLPYFFYTIYIFSLILNAI